MAFLIARTIARRQLRDPPQKRNHDAELDGNFMLISMG
jgi:hypothetical protein